MSDRTALILDGARGTGQTIARALTDAGTRLVLTDPAGEIADSTARTLGQTGFGCDSTDGAAMARLAYAAQDTLGDIDLVVLVLNGLPLRDTAAELRTPESDFDRLLAARSRPLFLAARHLAPAMRSRGQGAFLVVAPQSPTRDPWQDAATGWIAAATRSLAADWANDGLRINALVAARDESPPLPRFMASRSAPRPPVPLGLLPQPADIAAAALALCGETARSITGQVLILDGGRAL